MNIVPAPRWMRRRDFITMAGRWAAPTSRRSAQVIVSERTGDIGAAAAPDNSGYQRICSRRESRFHLHPVKIYADVELPVYNHVTGNQLIAPVLVKVSVSYMF